MQQAIAAMKTSLIIPAAEVRIRFHLLSNRQELVTSTYGIGIINRNKMPHDWTRPPNRLQTSEWASSWMSFSATQVSPSQAKSVALIELTRLL